MSRTRYRIGLIVPALCIASAVPSASLAQSQEERALAAVREKIAVVETRLARQIEQRDDESAELKRLDLEIGGAKQRLAELGREASGQEARLKALGEETRGADRRLAAERDALASQVRTRYITGRQEVFKLLFSQESPTSLGRMLVYYDYFNRARSARIERIGTELKHLATLAEQGRLAAEELERLEAGQERELAALDEARGARRAVLARIEQSIETSGGEIERLRQEERRLDELVVELGTLLARLPRDSEAPFGDLAGRLTWPVPGRLASDFGSLRGGGPLRWNGVLLEAEAGTSVRAVYHGRVAFADWLPGLGLLLIVDHGDGYMSLYGHNEALLREPGDWVRPGEVIAEVGSSGGQAAPALYFEIRRNGEPTDPKRWMAGFPEADHSRLR